MEEREKLLTEGLERVYFQDGDYIIRQGEVGDSFYIVICGTVRVTKSAKSKSNDKDLKEGTGSNMDKMEEEEVAILSPVS
jgi:hypothetical protein